MEVLTYNLAKDIYFIRGTDTVKCQRSELLLVEWWHYVVRPLQTEKWVSLMCCSIEICCESFGWCWVSSALIQSLLSDLLGIAAHKTSPLCKGTTSITWHTVMISLHYDAWFSCIHVWHYSKTRYQLSSCPLTNTNWEGNSQIFLYYFTIVSTTNKPKDPIK